MTVESIVQLQKNFFHTNATKDLAFRKHNLELLLEALHENEEQLYFALKKDLNQSEEEAYLSEIYFVIKSIKDTIKNIYKWAKPESKKTNLLLFPAKSKIIKEPLGVVLIISPWNYPVSLSLLPLIGAIAAGNCAVLKTSRSCPHTSAVLASMINNTFDLKYIHVLDEESSYNTITSCPYDFIFFTGSPRVGKMIMRAASENLTPVCLELGGKSPCIIDKSAKVDLAAKRIVLGKIANAGQTCVAPDYVVIHEELKDEFIACAKKYISQFVGDPFTNENYPRIINLHHFMRLTNLIHNESDLIGGKTDDKQFKIEPTIFPNTTFDSDIMREEIFGPILPVITYTDLDSVIDTIKLRPKPLACYIFGQNNSFIRKVLKEISFGGGCINNTFMQIGSSHLPFGGVGNSGMGKYHGKYSFDIFSNQKSILINKSSFDIHFDYPPYTKKNLHLIKRFLK